MKLTKEELIGILKKVGFEESVLKNLKFEFYKKKNQYLISGGPGTTTGGVLILDLNKNGLDIDNIVFDDLGAMDFFEYVDIDNSELEEL